MHSNVALRKCWQNGEVVHPNQCELGKQACYNAARRGSSGLFASRVLATRDCHRQTNVTDSGKWAAEKLPFVLLFLIMLLVTVELPSPYAV